MAVSHAHDVAVLVALVPRLGLALGHRLVQVAGPKSGVPCAALGVAPVWALGPAQRENCLVLHRRAERPGERLNDVERSGAACGGRLVLDDRALKVAVDVGVVVTAALQELVEPLHLGRQSADDVGLGSHQIFGGALALAEGGLDHQLDARRGRLSELGQRRFLLVVLAPVVVGQVEHQRIPLAPARRMIWAMTTGSSPSPLWSIYWTSSRFPHW